MRRVLKFISMRMFEGITYAYVLIGLMVFPSNMMRFTCMACVFMLILTCYEVKSFSSDILIVEFISIMAMTDFLMHVAIECEVKCRRIFSG